MKPLLYGIILIGGLFFGMGSFSQNLITVTDCNLNGWVKQTSQEGATITFKNATPDPILGKGSLEFFTPQLFVRLRNTQYHHSLLSTFTVFSYSTYIYDISKVNDVPYIILQIDITGDDIAEDALAFNPQFQTGHYAKEALAPDQGMVQANVWQTWDLLHGAWWLGPPPRPDPYQGGPVFSLATYISKNPTARIVNPGAMGTGGIRLTAGGPSGVFTPITKANVDNFRIGINGVTTVYDFEFTTADAGQDQQVIYGYGSNCVQLNGNPAGGVAPYSYSWSPGGSSPNSITTQVCPETTTKYSLTVTDANGCARADEVTVYVKDVRCGKELDKVTLCHKGRELCVATASVPSHLNHGDELGGCDPQALMNKTGNSAEMEVSAPVKLSNYPNPFSTVTRITYELLFDARVSLKVYDITGREVATIADEKKGAGQHSILFSSGSLDRGLYYYKIIVVSPTKKFMQTGRMMIIH